MKKMPYINKLRKYAGLREDAGVMFNTGVGAVNGFVDSVHTTNDILDTSGRLYNNANSLKNTSKDALHGLGKATLVTGGATLATAAIIVAATKIAKNRKRQRLNSK